MPTSSLATLRAQGLEHEAQLVADLLRLSRVTVLLAPEGSDAGTFLKNYVMPLLAAGPGTEDSEVCVFFDAWHDASHSELLAETRSAVTAVKGSPGEILDPASLSLADALTSWQQAFDVRFILVLDRFEKLLERPADEVTLAFHRQLVDLLNKPQLRINVLISIDERADALLALLRAAVPGFGEATLRLPGGLTGVTAEPSNFTAHSMESVAVEVVPLKPSAADALVDPPATPEAHASVVPLNAVAVTTAPFIVEAPPTPTRADLRDEGNEATDTPAKAVTVLPSNASSPADTETQPRSRARRWGWFALAAFLLFLLVMWIQTPASKRPASPPPRASSVQPPQAASRELPPPAITDAPKPAAQVKTLAPAPSPTAEAAPAIIGTEKTVSSDPPTLHIHVRDQSQRAWAETFVANLAQRGIRVSGVRLVPVGPHVMDVRYFRPDEAQEASQVARALRDIGIGSPRLKHIGGYENAAIPRRYELWLGPVKSNSDR